jgi:glycosyltransferase involved in cell wall biosynthesis
VTRVDVVGYLREAKGIGQAARLYATALEAASLEVRTGAIVAGNTPLAEGAHRGLDELRGRSDAALLCLNAPELQRAFDEGLRLPRARRRLGVWAWEVDPAPREWAATAQELDEVWVYSRYVEELLRPVLDVPVAAVPLPVLEPRPEGPPDPRTADGFSFLFLFDFHSMLQRKNPLGLIDAFMRAFAPGEGPRLVLKSFNGDQRPDELARLREAAAGRPDIEVIDEYVSRGRRNAMLAGCDCYVSLHRAEGFGLPLAEAMALGKPVIATGYSGNLDFTTPENAYLVDGTPAAVGEENDVYPPDARWAEPDLDHAASLMRRVYEQPDEARARGERGRRLVRERLSPEAVGRVARERLERLAAAPRRRRGGLARLLGR